MNILLAINKCELCNNKASHVRIFTYEKNYIFYNKLFIGYFLLCDDHRLISKRRLIELER